MKKLHGAGANWFANRDWSALNRRAITCQGQIAKEEGSS